MKNSSVLSWFPRDFVYLSLYILKLALLSSVSFSEVYSHHISSLLSPKDFMQMLYFLCLQRFSMYLPSWRKHEQVLFTIITHLDSTIFKVPPCF